MIVRNEFFIDGRWVSPLSADRTNVINAFSEEVIASIPMGNSVDVDCAVAAAAKAFDSWSALPASRRSRYLQNIALGLQKRAEELAQVICAEVGMPIKLSRIIQVNGPIAQWNSIAELLENYAFEENVDNSLVSKEAVGVVAAITPWNYPLHQITLKVAAALAAGCTVVLKPSEVAPLNAFILAEIIEEAGLPAGVFNLVTGLGSIVGEALTAHPDVNMVSFTGSTDAGKRVAARGAESVKRISLELGGKSASVILPDADFPQAIKATLGACFLNSGQTCSALTRMLVPASRYEESKALAQMYVKSFIPDDPSREATRLGPLISSAQKQRVLALIEQGLADGAELISGGLEKPEGFEKGFFVQPTILGRVDSRSVVGQQEIFGPVLAVICYDNIEHAIQIANDSAYGLSGAVWSGTTTGALEVARRLRTGQVSINGGPFNPLAPFGGFKQSGHGREAGVFGVDEFLEYKAYQLPR